MHTHGKIKLRRLALQLYFSGDTGRQSEKNGVSSHAVTGD